MSKYISLVVFVFALSFPLKAQRLLNKEICLFNYDVHLSSELANAMAPLKRYIDANDYYNQKGTDLIKASIMNRTYSKLTRLLETNVECYILPVNSFGKRFKYNNYNYPKGTIKKAMRHGISKYYFKVDLKVKAAHPENIELKAGEFIPEIHLTLTLFNSIAHHPLKKFEGTAIGKTPLANEKEVLDGLLKGTKAEDSNANLMMTVNIAIEEVVRKMKLY